MTDPASLVSSGDLNKVLSGIVIVLAIVAVKLYADLQFERRERIKDLKDFNVQSYNLMQQSSQKESLLYGKIETVRNGGS